MVLWVDCHSFHTKIVYWYHHETLLCFLRVWEWCLFLRRLEIAFCFLFSLSLSPTPIHSSLDKLWVIHCQRTAPKSQSHSESPAPLSFISTLHLLPQHEYSTHETFSLTIHHITTHCWRHAAIRTSLSHKVESFLSTDSLTLNAGRRTIDSIRRTHVRCFGATRSSNPSRDTLQKIRSTTPSSPQVPFWATYESCGNGDRRTTKNCWSGVVACPGIGDRQSTEEKRRANVWRDWGGERELEGLQLGEVEWNVRGVSSPLVLSHRRSWPCTPK